VTFADAFAPRAEGDIFAASVPEGWAQGRATFGGLVLAQTLAAARRRLDEPRPCRSIAASFPAPVARGPVTIDARPLRHGRAVSHLHAELRQGDAIGCVALLSFGAARPSAIEVPPPPRPAIAPPEELPTLANPLAPPPEFTKFFDYRLAFGGRPYSGSSSTEMGGWCRFRDEPGPLGEEHALALVDAWPSPAVARFAAPAPAASMTWAIELLPVEPDIGGDGWWLYHAALDAVGDGYAHAAARLWSPAGRLAALSRQAVAIFG
jgi:acyl-CoA thioesterase